MEDLTFLFCLPLVDAIISLLALYLLVSPNGGFDFSILLSHHCQWLPLSTFWITTDVEIKHKFLGQEDFVSADVNVVWQRPNAASESIYGPTVYHHQIEETTCRRQPVRAFRAQLFTI
ncbi:hypothetical protein AVEN_58013-1, partial [Araneus ventricosus]